MKTEIIKQEIDKKNIENWSLRYENPYDVIENSKKIIDESNEIVYKKGVYAAKLNISASNFLLSSHSNSIISELYEIISFFENEVNEFYVNSLNLTSNILHSYGDFKSALNMCLKGQTIAIELNNQELLADNFSICGLIYSDLTDYENAIKNFKKALEIREKTDNYKAIASSLNLSARTNTLMGNYGEALIFYEKALALRYQINDEGGLPWTYIGIASTYEKMNDYLTAIQNYEKALEVNQKFDDKRCKLHCYMGIGCVKSIISPSKIAEDYLLEAKKYAEELNSKQLLYKIYKDLSELYERMLDIPKAFVYYKMYQTCKEEVLNTKIQNQLKNQEIIFAVEKSQKEAEIYRLKNVELKNAYEQLEKQNQEIRDSINYAKNIQLALLPSSDYIDDFFPDRFVFYKPKDIVSGDFYWLNKVDNQIIVAVADCTGHGVPGAFLSMLGISFLNEIVNKNKILRPDLILNELRNMVITVLNKNKREVNDGMDISLVVINLEDKMAQYAGAFNPLFVVRNNLETSTFEIISVDGDRMPIGLYIKNNEPFLNKQIQLQKNDSIYLFSDGYSDQFGGTRDNKQKFMKKRFKQVLTDIQNHDMKQQKLILENIFMNWKADMPQTDDVTLIGIRI